MLEFLPFACIIAVILIALLFVAVYFIKKQYNKQPLITRRCKVVEKTLNVIEWDVVEFENGERKKLRNLEANTIIISEGDIGVITYRGITIESFKREK